MLPRTAHLRASDFKTMPWKNGGGSTTEIAIFPKDSSVNETFLWRVSLAQLDGSGPFSSFPGYDRIITQLNGKAMTLRHEDPAAEKSLERMVPYFFKGEWKTEGLLDGKAQDFNLMLRRDACRGSLQSLAAREIPSRLSVVSENAMIWVAQGHLSAEIEGQKYQLKNGDALTLDHLQDRFIALADISNAAILFWITIDPVSIPAASKL